MCSISHIEEIGFKLEDITPLDMLVFNIYKKAGAHLSRHTHTQNKYFLHYSLCPRGVSPSSNIFTNNKLYTTDANPTIIHPYTKDEIVRFLDLHLSDDDLYNILGYTRRGVLENLDDLPLKVHSSTLWSIVQTKQKSTNGLDTLIERSQAKISTNYEVCYFIFALMILWFCYKTIHYY